MRQKFSLVHSINAFLLKVLLLPSGVYERSGVNLRHLRSIVHAKLLVDERVPSSVFGTVANKRTGTLMVIFASLLVGAGMLIPFVFLDDLTRLTVFFGIYLIMLSMFLVVDFSHVLIDVRDNAVILPKPISAATFITARLVYIGIHFSKIVIPMILPAIVAMAVSRGLWAMFVFFLLVILCTFFAVLLVNLIYLIAIRFFSAERFKSLIATIQIVLSIVLFAGYQLVSRSAVEIAFAHVVVSDSLWMWLNPPYWFAQAWMLGYTWDGGLAHLAGAALSVGMTVLGVYVVVKYFAPYFQHRLAAIGQGTASIRAVTLSKSSGRTSLTYIMARIVARKQATRAGFLFAWKMMSRSREFKMKFYPQVGYILVLVCVPFISYFRSFITGELDTARLVVPLISTVYMIAVPVISSMLLSAQSSNFKAGWIFYASPQATPGRIILGSMLACTIKFGVIPIFLAWTGTLILLGPTLFPDLVFATTNVFLACVLIIYLMHQRLPFTYPPLEENGFTSVRMFFLFITLGFLALPHILLHHFPVILWIGAVVGLTLALLLVRAMSRLSWKQVKVTADGI